MSNEEITKLTLKVEELLNTNSDNSWSRWSQYTIKAIEGLSEDIKEINMSRETMRIELSGLSELKNSVVRIEKSIQDFSDFKEQIIAPLRIKVAVLAVISGFFGGAMAACIPVLLKYLLGASQR